MTNNNIQFQNIKSSQDYDNYLRQYIVKYSVTTKVAPGKYTTKFFPKYKGAKSYLGKLQKKDHLTQSIIYGVSKPPHTIMEVNVTMENMV
tara:strand:- start:241 stop:510 length:270 start_codon:yes stop_codon:yes gene_type:complete